MSLSVEKSTFTLTGAIAPKDCVAALQPVSWLRAEEIYWTNSNTVCTYQFFHHQNMQKTKTWLTITKLCFNQLVVWALGNWFLTIFWHFIHQGATLRFLIFSWPAVHKPKLFRGLKKNEIFTFKKLEPENFSILFALTQKMTQNNWFINFCQSTNWLIDQ